eukprot:TRINITY_DN20492_c0_g1_i1.p1 TRINITY_DN20492_c0_g1~~TRINITY_DN20492_c0_g1_i1.p1  ORF type:complete len:637 (+),score=86.63 TRINITY_DN20492_c0_g1_i1:148-2058(+)
MSEFCFSPEQSQKSRRGDGGDAASAREFQEMLNNFVLAQRRQQQEHERSLAQLLLHHFGAGQGPSWMPEDLLGMGVTRTGTPKSHAPSLTVPLAGASAVHWPGDLSPVSGRGRAYSGRSGPAYSVQGGVTGGGIPVSNASAFTTPEAEKSKVEAMFGDRMNDLERRARPVLKRAVSKLNRQSKCMRDSMLRRIMTSRAFNLVLSFLVTANIVLTIIALEDFTRYAFDSTATRRAYEDSIQTTYEIPSWIMNADIAFCIVFGVEITTRLIVLESDFWFGNSGRWNIIDLIAVSTHAVELSITHGSTMYDYYPVLRTLRMTRLIRMFRLMTVFPKLRLLVVATRGSVELLFWASVFLFVTMISFAIVIQQTVADHVYVTIAGDSELKKLFGTFSLTILNLFMAVTGGKDWWEVESALLNVSIEIALLFVFFILVMVFCVCNLITGIFVEGAIDVARKDRDVAVHAEVERAVLATDQLKSLFEELDENHTGHISLDEFRALAGRQDLRAFFATLGLDVSKPEVIFRLLDVDQSQYLEVDEFVIGVMGLKGQARSVDIATLRREHRKHAKQWCRLWQQTSDQLQAIYRLLGGHVPTAMETLPELDEVVSLERPDSPSPLASGSCSLAEAMVRKVSDRSLE